MVIKNIKKTNRTSEKNLIYKFFMEEQLPMAITRAKDGTYVAANKAAGEKREQIFILDI